MKKDFKLSTKKGLSIFILILLMLATVGSLAKDTPGNVINGGLIGGSISSGTATYTIVSYTSTIGLDHDLTISDGVSGDSAFESGWLYRVAGDTEEHRFPAPDTENYGVDQVLLTWSDVDSRGLFSAELLIEIDQPVAESAVLTNTLVLTNITAVDGDFDVFNYSDLDVGGSFANDIANLITSPGYIEIIDGVNFAEFRAGDPSSYQVSPFSVLRSSLIDSGITALNNSGLPMAANDFTGAFQWATTTVPPNGTYHIQTTVALNTTTPEPMAAFVDLIFANGFE